MTNETRFIVKATYDAVVIHTNFRLVGEHARRVAQTDGVEFALVGEYTLDLRIGKAFVLKEVVSSVFRVLADYFDVAKVLIEGDFADDLTREIKHRYYTEKKRQYRNEITRALRAKRRAQRVIEDRQAKLAQLKKARF